MSASAAALTVFLAPLLIRHVPQVIFDIRNRHRQVIRSAKPPARAVHLIGIWAIVHSVAALQLSSTTSDLRWITLVGLQFVVVGCMLGFWALLSLAAGRAYHIEVVVVEGATLVRNHAYAVVRHPLRLALAIEILGSVVISRQPILLLLWLLLVTGQIVRSRHEDELLRQHYGTAAVRYQQKVPAANLLVGVWRIVRHRSHRSISD